MEGDNVIAEHSTVAFWEQGGLLHSTLKLSTFKPNCLKVEIIQTLDFFLFASIMLDILGLHVTVSTLLRVYQKIQFKGTVIWAKMTLG